MSSVSFTCTPINPTTSCKALIVPPSDFLESPNHDLSRLNETQTPWTEPGMFL